MKIFIDTADIGEIKEAMSMGVLDGVTTNPSLVAKTGQPFEACIKQILEVVPGPVSVEGVGTTHAEMVEEGKKYAAWGENVVIKVPIIEEGLKAIKTLADEMAASVLPEGRRLDVFLMRVAAHSCRGLDSVKAVESVHESGAAAGRFEGCGCFEQAERIDEKVEGCEVIDRRLNEQDSRGVRHGRPPLKSATDNEFYSVSRSPFFNRWPMRSFLQRR